VHSSNSTVKQNLSLELCSRTDLNCTFHGKLKSKKELSVVFISFADVRFGVYKLTLTNGSKLYISKYVDYGIDQLKI